MLFLWLDDRDDHRAATSLRERPRTHAPPPFRGGVGAPPRARLSQCENYCAITAHSRRLPDTCAGIPHARQPTPECACLSELKARHDTAPNKNDDSPPTGSFTTRECLSRRSPHTTRAARGGHLRTAPVPRRRAPQARPDWQAQPIPTLPDPRTDLI